MPSTRKSKLLIVLFVVDFAVTFALKARQASATSNKRSCIQQGTSARFHW
jgi:hypothetical protein